MCSQVKKTSHDDNMDNSVDDAATEQQDEGFGNDVDWDAVDDDLDQAGWDQVNIYIYIHIYKPTL